MALAIGGGAAYRRYKRRLNAVRDRAKGVPVVATAAQSLARAQSATPKIDRVARRWLPRRDLLAARLARTGRAITIGQYALMIVGVAVLSTSRPPLCFARSASSPTLLIALFLGMALPHLVIGRMGKRRVASVHRACFPTPST